VTIRRPRVWPAREPVWANRRRHLHDLGAVAAAAIAALVVMAAPGSAQVVTEPALKAAYIYNFAKFTEWPAGAVPAGQPLKMCVIGDQAVEAELARTVKNRELAGHKMLVSRLPLTGSPETCHILYVSGVTSDQAAHAIAALADTPVLTLSDVDGFTEHGGIARFFFERGRLCFDVDIPAVKRARLLISSRLLTMAKKQ